MVFGETRTAAGFMHFTNPEVLAKKQSDQSDDGREESTVMALKSFPKYNSGAPSWTRVKGP